MPPFQIKTSEEEGVHLITVSGELDAATTEEFKNVLDSIRVFPGVKVLLNVLDLRFVNSRSIGVLVQFQRRVSDGAGQIHFSGMNARMIKHLEHYLGKAFFKNFASKKEAMEAF